MFKHQDAVSKNKTPFTHQDAIQKQKRSPIQVGGGSETGKPTADPEATCMMDDMLELWHLRMSDAIMLKYVKGIKAFARLSRARYPPTTGITAASTAGLAQPVRIPTMSVCSGCGIAEKGLHKLSQFYKSRYATDFEWVSVSLCEIQENKLEFLGKQHPECPWLVRDMHELSEDMVVNRRFPNQGRQLFPIQSECLAGFTCKSLTTLNKNSGANTGCCQSGEADTGAGWAQVLFTYAF